jgi:hypothetical protein
MTEPAAVQARTDGPSPVAAEVESRLTVVVTGRFPERTFVFLLVALVTITVISFAAHAADRLWGIDSLFGYLNVDSEGNLPTWFATALLLAAAALLMVIAYTPVANRPRRWYWILMSIVFLLLSIDEATRLHETLGESLRDAWNTDGLLRFAWVVPYGVAGIVLLVVLVPFLLALPDRTRNLFLLAGFIYVLGAAGLNAVNGALLSGDPAKGVVGVVGHFEEVLEMFGVSLMIYALLDHVRVNPPTTQPAEA